jgi:hypothetical protein
LKKRKPALPAGEVDINIVEAEQSFNRKVAMLRDQRKQVVFTTVEAFSARRTIRSGIESRQRLTITEKFIPTGTSSRQPKLKQFKLETHHHALVTSTRHLQNSTKILSKHC